jgi:hypothetical protein
LGDLGLFLLRRPECSILLAGGLPPHEDSSPASDLWTTFGLAILVVAGVLVASRDALLERLYLSRLDSADREVRRAAIEKLRGIRAKRVDPRVLEISRADPAALVSFVEAEYDGVFVVVDRSGGFYFGLPYAKELMTRMIEDFSPESSYGVVFADRGVTQFPHSGQPAHGDPSFRASALEFVASVSGGAGSCIENGLQAALQLASSSPARKKAILYIGDGGGTCDGSAEEEYLESAVENVVKANKGYADFWAVGVNVNSLHRSFLRDLTEINAGRCVEIKLDQPRRRRQRPQPRVQLRSGVQLR